MGRCCIDIQQKRKNELDSRSNTSLITKEAHICIEMNNIFQVLFSSPASNLGDMIKISPELEPPGAVLSRNAAHIWLNASPTLDRGQIINDRRT